MDVCVAAYQHARLQNCNLLTACAEALMAYFTGYRVTTGTLNKNFFPASCSIKPSATSNTPERTVAKAAISNPPDRTVAKVRSSVSAEQTRDNINKNMIEHLPSTEEMIAEARYILSRWPEQSDNKLLLTDNDRLKLEKSWIYLNSTPTILN